MIKEKLDNLIRESMFANSSVKTEVLRSIKTKFMEWETAKNAKPLDEQAVIRKMISDRLNSAEIYNNCGRKDLEERELLEINYLSEFKDKDVTEEQIKEVINEAILSDVKEFGLIMKFIKSKLPSANMKLSSNILKEIMQH